MANTDTKESKKSDRIEGRKTTTTPSLQTYAEGTYLAGEADDVLVHAGEGEHDGESGEGVEPVIGVLVGKRQLGASDALRVEQQVALGVLHGLRDPLVQERRRGGAGLGHHA